MRLAVNLASVPFRKDRAILMASLAVGLLMVGVLVMMMYLIWLEKDEGKETAVAIRQVESQLSTLSNEEARLQSVMHQPENAAVLERSLFLNDLLRRKGISWTLIFSDLETVVPYNVKILQVRPQVNASAERPGQHEILLDMSVAAEDPEPIINLLQALEKSSLFGATAISTALPPTETEPLYRYRVSVRYAREL
jgi:type IV pilus assembly protein PilN